MACIGGLRWSFILTVAVVTLTVSETRARNWNDGHPGSATTESPRAHDPKVEGDWWSALGAASSYYKIYRFARQHPTLVKFAIKAYKRVGPQVVALYRYYLKLINTLVRYPLYRQIYPLIPTSVRAYFQLPASSDQAPPNQRPRNKADIDYSY
mmetsp:Transcript_12678/g.38846  ORF Transcript_12678/g.38846 Transcript_12678/m.38846 type:complete len:153 (+) Transcript_12678:59-517(+)